MSRRDYKRGANRPKGIGAVVLRDAADEVDAYYAAKQIEARTAREREEQRELEKRLSITLAKLKLSGSTKRVLAYNELDQTFGNMLAEAWQTNDPRLAERFSEATKKAHAEYPGDFATAIRKAWESDPELREQLGKAVSEGLRKMWADPAARKLQSKRTKATYQQGDLRERRSEHFKKLWCDPDTREKLLAGVQQKRDNQQFAEAVSAAQKKNWDDPRKRAQRLARIAATKAARPPLPSRDCGFCGKTFVPARENTKYCCRSCAHRDWIRRLPSPPSQACLFCGKMFSHAKASRAHPVVFCSQACVNRARARRANDNHDNKPKTGEAA